LDASRARRADSRVRLGMARVTLDDEQLARVDERSQVDLGGRACEMPSDQREAVMRRVVLEQDYPAIADELCCSEQVARKRVSRGACVPAKGIGGTAMTDPFDLLRADLVRVAAAARPRRASWPRGRPWLRRRPRGLVLVAAALIISGSAVGAVISLHASGSQRLAGTVPGAPTRPTSSSSPVSVRGDQYRIEVFPLLTAGGVGWCTGITYTYHGKPGRYSGFGQRRSDFPTRGVPLFRPDVSGGGYAAPSPQIGDTVHFLLTGPGVEYVRVGQTTLAVRRGDPDVPAGDGAAVFFLPAATPPLYLMPAGTRPPYYVRLFVPPHSSRDQLPPWLPRKSGLHRVRATPTVALDRLGRVIPYPVSGGYFVPSRWWQRPGRQPDGNCQLARRGLPGLVAHWGHVTDRIRAVSSARGTAFLSCLSTETTWTAGE
jgi:hypothetical protein